MVRYARALAVVAAALIALAASAHALVIGVDLGTEFMKVALVKPGRPFEIVLNGFSKRKTTVAVGFDPTGERLYGKNALGLFTKKPHLYYGQLRRLLGRNASHPVVQDALQQLFNAQDVATDPDRGTLLFRHASTQTAEDTGADSGADDKDGAKRIFRGETETEYHGGRYGGGWRRCTRTVRPRPSFRCPLS